MKTSLLDVFLKSFLKRVDVREALMSKKKRDMLRKMCLLSVRHLAFFTKNESVKMQNSFGQTFSNEISQELYVLEKKRKFVHVMLKRRAIFVPFNPTNICNLLKGRYSASFFRTIKQF